MAANESDMQVQLGPPSHTTLTNSKFRMDDLHSIFHNAEEHPNHLELPTHPTDWADEPESPFYNASETPNSSTSSTISTSDPPVQTDIETPNIPHLSQELINDHTTHSKALVSKHDLAYFTLKNTLNQLKRVQRDILSEHNIFYIALEEAGPSIHELLDQQTSHLRTETLQTTASDLTRAALGKLSHTVGSERKTISRDFKQLADMIGVLVVEQGRLDAVQDRVMEEIDRLRGEQDMKPKQLVPAPAIRARIGILITAIKAQWASIWYANPQIAPKRYTLLVVVAYHAFFIICTNLVAFRGYSWWTGSEFLRYGPVGYSLVADVLKMSVVALMELRRPIACPLMMLLLMAIEVNGWVWFRN